MAIRKSWGRWLGVAGLTVMLIAAGLTQTSRILTRLENAGIAQNLVGLIIGVLVVGGTALLIYKLAAGDRADEFFTGRSSPGRNEVETLPPSD